MTETLELEWVPVVAAEEIAEGEIRAIEIRDLNIAVYHCDDGNYRATDNVCTHALAYLSDGFLEGTTIECPLHGGCFDICTGKGLGAPITVDLKTYALRIIDGVIELGLPQ